MSGSHIIQHEGRIVFQSDLHADLPPNKIILSLKDPKARRAMRGFAEDREEPFDSELSRDILLVLNDIKARIDQAAVDCVLVCKSCLKEDPVKGPFYGGDGTRWHHTDGRPGEFACDASNIRNDIYERYQAQLGTVPKETP